MIRDLFDELLQEFGSALGIDAMLGRPALSRVNVRLPVCALEFESVADLTVPRLSPRLGQTQTPGATISVKIYVFAVDEAQLLDLVERLLAVRKAISTVGKFRIRYGEVIRYDSEVDSELLDFAIMQPATLTIESLGE